MKIIEPSVVLWEQKDNISHVARCARICYGKETGDDNKTYQRLLNSKHWSMFRHQSVYAILDYDYAVFEVLIMFAECPYIEYKTENNKLYISTNYNFILYLKENSEQSNIYSKLYGIIINNEVSAEVFENTEIGFNMMRYTFCVVTQISTSRELNRVSPNNIAERSTRYVYEDRTICRPHWMTKEEAYYFSNEPILKEYVDSDEHKKAYRYYNSCNNAFINYEKLIDSYGFSKQDARGVLPLDTATKCIYTYSIYEWRKIIDLRFYGTTGVPHPNAKIIAGMIRETLIELGYDFRI